MDTQAVLGQQPRDDAPSPGLLGFSAEQIPRRLRGCYAPHNRLAGTVLATAGHVKAEGSAVDLI